MVEPCEHNFHINCLADHANQSKDITHCPVEQRHISAKAVDLSESILRGMVDAAKKGTIGSIHDLKEMRAILEESRSPHSTLPLEIQKLFDFVLQAARMESSSDPVVQDELTNLFLGHSPDFEVDLNPSKMFSLRSALRGMAE